MEHGIERKFAVTLTIKTFIILLTNQEAVALHLPAEAIAEKLFWNGKQ